MFSGSIVALITPFNQDGVDEKAFRQLIQWHLAEGTKGIVVAGSTGEGLLLSDNEWEHVITLAVQEVAGRIPVIAGCSGASTQGVVDMVKKAEKLGTQGALVVTPFYVRPSTEGIYQHYQQISEASSLPIILYNNPGRTGTDLSEEAIARLATLKSIVGIKDSNPDVERLPRLKKLISKPFAYLSGDDVTAADYMAKGGDGCISVTANVAPSHCQKMMDLWAKKDGDAFDGLVKKLAPLHEALLAETNPSPSKYALWKLNKCQNIVRSPLVTISSSTEEKINKALLMLKE